MVAQWFLVNIEP